jgi:energy-converting hydrogenase Eha subunit A
MVQLNARTVFSLLICLFAALMLFQTFDLRSDAALVPRVIGVPLLLLAGFQFLCDLFPALGTRFSFAGTDKGALDNSSHDEGSGLKGNYLFVAWMVLFVLAIYFTGVIAGIVIAFFIYLKWLIRQSWMLSVLYTLIFALSVYLIFVQGMGVYYFTSPVG